jgi:hypothetical protein
MPGGDRIAGKGNDSTLKSLKAGGITRGELQRGAKNLLNFILNTPVLREKIKKSE